MVKKNRIIKPMMATMISCMMPMSRIDGPVLPPPGKKIVDMIYVAWGKIKRWLACAVLAVCGANVCDLIGAHGIR